MGYALHAHRHFVEFMTSILTRRLSRLALWKPDVRETGPEDRFYGFGSMHITACSSPLRV